MHPSTPQAGESQVALLQPGASFGDPGGDHFALKLRERREDVQHEVVLGRLAKLQRCHHDQRNIYPAKLMQAFRKVAQVA